MDLAKYYFAVNNSGLDIPINGNSLELYLDHLKYILLSIAKPIT